MIKDIGKSVKNEDMKVVFGVIWSWENVKKFTAVSFKNVKTKIKQLSSALSLIIIINILKIWMSR
jgi:hypothetical protein